MEEEGIKTGNDTAECNIESARKVLEIRTLVENVSKIQTWVKTASPGFYLTPECMCSLLVGRDRTGLYVNINNISDIEIKIDREIVFLDCNYKKLHEETDAKIFSLKMYKELEVIGSLNLNKCDALTDDKLVIDLRVRIMEPDPKQINRFVFEKTPLRKLRDDFKTMLENTVNSDVLLQVGDEQIAAHWSVLCSRSPYFKEMFDSGMKERTQNSITITDIYFGTIKKLIRFLYTADFAEEDDLSELFDLYYASDKYEVMDLRNLCASKIMNNATTENVWDILQLALRHNDKNLKMESMDFIQLHSAAAFETEKWKIFKVNEPVVADLIDYFCLKKN